MTFDDIKFVPHATVPGAVMGRLDLQNGIRLSVVGGGFGLYGDGVDTFEVLVSTHDDVIGHQTREDIDELIAGLEKE